MCNYARHGRMRADEFTMEGRRPLAFRSAAWSRETWPTKVSENMISTTSSQEKARLFALLCPVHVMVCVFSCGLICTKPAWKEIQLMSEEEDRKLADRIITVHTSSGLLVPTPFFFLTKALLQNFMCAEEAPH